MKVRRLPMEQFGPILEEQIRSGAASLPVTGSSMLPMLREGRDIVLLVPVEGVPRRGDVLFYRRMNGQYVLHRLIRMEDENTCLCCGDNQWQRELLPLSCVLARVERVRRAGKQYDLNTCKIYRLYATIWTALFPVRRPILGVRRLLGWLRRKIKPTRRESK